MRHPAALAILHPVDAARPGRGDRRKRPKTKTPGTVGRRGARSSYVVRHSAGTLKTLVSDGIQVMPANATTVV
jgi:hypothetical protein